MKYLLLILVLFTGSVSAEIMHFRAHGGSEIYTTTDADSNLNIIGKDGTKLYCSHLEDKKVLTNDNHEKLTWSYECDPKIILVIRQDTSSYQWDVVMVVRGKTMAENQIFADVLDLIKD